MGNINMARNTLFTIECIDCKIRFTSKVSIAKRCESCRVIHKTQRFKTHMSTPLKRTPKACERCAKLFTPKSNNVRFCSDCKAELKRLQHLRKPILKCPLCGSLFIKTGNNQKRCKTCQFKQLYSGDYRTIAFENLPHRCNRCNVEVSMFIADVHHKDRDRQNNRLENLEILCKSCHYNEHIVRDTNTGKIITNK